MASVSSVRERSGLASMIALALCLALGLLFAQRFKVLVLVPATTLVVLVALTSGIASSETLWIKMLMGGAAAGSLQLGYLLGLGARALLVSTPTSLPRSPLANSRKPTQRTAN